MSEPPGPDRWWGWGDPPSARAAAGDRARDAARRARRRRARSERSSSSAVELPEPRPLPPGLADDRRRGRAVVTGHEERLRHAAGKGLSGPDPARATGAGRARSGRRRHSRGRGRGRGRCSSVCSAERDRGRPVRRRHERRRRRRAAARAARRPDRARPRPHARGRGRPGLADRDARARACAAPRPSDALGAARLHARALPAVVRVRDDRRLRRDPLGRPGLERLRALRRARHRARGWRPRSASCARCATPSHRRRTRAARAGARLGGRARSDHGGHRCGCARRRRRAATRPGSPPTSRPAREIVRALAQDDCAARRDAALRRGGDAGLAGARREPAARSASRSTHT